MPNLTEGDFFYIGQEGRGIFRAEAENVHFGRVQIIAGDLDGIEGVSHHDEACLQAV